MDSIFVYYDSKTGNVERFIEKVRRKRPEWKFIKITNKSQKKNHRKLRKAWKSKENYKKWWKKRWKITKSDKRINSIIGIYVQAL